MKRKVRRELIGTSDYPSNQIFTVSNIITFSRLILTGVFLYMFVTDKNRYVALAIYAIAASTDWLDGYIARATKSVSWLGKILDPICDRALLFTGVLGIVIRGELPLWVCFFVILRDIYLGIGGLIVRRYHRRPIDVVYVGKVATAFLMSGFTLILFGLPILPGLALVPGTITWLPGLNGVPCCLGVYVVYVGVICSAITALVYTVNGYKAMRQAMDHPEDEDQDFLHPEIIED